MSSALPQRDVTLFRNGRNQAVRIPREFELPGTKAVMRKDGARLIIEPATRPTFADALAALRAMPPVTDDLPELEDSPPGDIDW